MQTDCWREYASTKDLTMSILEDKANEVARHMAEDKVNPVEGVACFAVMTILMILSCLIGAIQIWQACGSPPLVATESLKGGGTPLTRMQLRKVIRIKSRDVPHAERKEFRASMNDAIHKMGENVTVDEMQKMFDEADERAKKEKEAAATA